MRDMKARRIMKKIIGINFQLFGGNIISKAYADHWTTYGGEMRLHTVIENWPDSITCK